MVLSTKVPLLIPRWKNSLFNPFDWGRSWRKNSEQLKAQPPSRLYYHDIDLPFPQSLVANTFLEGRELKCCYRASVDGFTATSFHNSCDFKGPCVVVGYTAATATSSFKFGGFNPEGFRSTDDYYDTFDAFLFYWPDQQQALGTSNITTTQDGDGDGDCDGEQYPIILPKVGGSGAALFDYARGGPQFGADGLLIGPPLTPVMGVFTGPDASTGVGDLRQARSRLGLSYAKRPDGKESLFGDESRATLAEVQVFCSPHIATLYL